MESTRQHSRPRGKIGDRITIAARLFFAVLASFPLAGAAGAQEEIPGIGACREITVDPAHRLRSVVAPDTVDTLERQRFDWLRSDGVRAELELADAQVQSVKGLQRRLGAIDRYRREIVLSSMRDEDPAKRSAIGKKMTDECEGLRRDIEEVLLPAQSRRLSQLRNRKTVLELGLEEALIDELPARINLNEEESEKLRLCFNELRVSSETERLKHHQQLAEDVRRVLTKRQREWLAAEVGEVERYLAPSLEVLYCQMRQEAPQIDPSDTSLEELTKVPEHYRMNFTGALEPWDERGRDRFKRFRSMCFDGAYGDLEFVRSQIAAAAMPSGELLRELSLLRGKMAQYKQQVLDGTLAFEKSTQLADIAIDEFTKWRLDEFVGELVPHQRAELDRMILRRLIAVRGLPACLRDGSLGKALEVTDDQRSQIAKVASQRAESIDRAARLMETKIWSEVKMRMDEDSQGKLDELIGSMSPNLTGCPDLLLRRASDE
jgi:hypothetical protein